MSADDEAARQAALVAQAARSAEALLAVGAARAMHAEHAEFTTDVILNQVETGILVVDHWGKLRYVNAFAAALFGFPDPAHLTDKEFRSLGFEDDDLGKVRNLERQACRGRDWEGTLSVRRRSDKSIVFVRANAVPLRSPSGDVTGTVILARRAVQLGGGPGADKFGLLDRIGERLAKSLELDVTLRHVADTLVPQFADHCFIDLLQGDNLVRRTAMHAWGWEPPPGTWSQVGSAVSYPPEHFCSEAMTKRETVLVNDISEVTYQAPTLESLNVSRAVGMASVIASPLIARGRPLGVISLALSSLTQRDGQFYVVDDRDFVAAIASRVAIAIDNAMLFEEERDTARRFQDSLLPNDLPTLDGLRVAHRYTPAGPLETHGHGIQTQVGGDWYDIIPLSAGRVGIVIGDVMGRGARAAAIMGQLRSALRAFAQDDKAPAEILRRLDEWCRTLGAPRPGAPDDITSESPLVSCIYLVYDPWSRELTIANAGHMAPLLVTEGDVLQLGLENQGVMLGIPKGLPGVPTYREESRSLPPGSTLIFYTDGLVDRRQRLDGGGHYTDAEVLHMLHGAIQQVAHQGVEQIADAAEHAVPGSIDDDMAIVVVRTAEDDLDSWDHWFAAEPIKVSEARKRALETFIGWGMDPDQVDVACLLVSEVVTNVVLHTSALASQRTEFTIDSSRLPGVQVSLDDWEESPPYPQELSAGADHEFLLRIRKGADSIWVEVFDSDLRLPRIRMAGENDEGGRGLYLVDQLARKWGSRPTEQGKSVWFEMPIRSGPSL